MCTAWTHVNALGGARSCWRCDQRTEEQLPRRGEISDFGGSQGTVFTQGTSDRSATQFFGLLHGSQIQRLVDVRRFPTRCRFPHFSRRSLESLAPQKGLDYFYLGNLLGGYRRGGYRLYLTSSKFLAGIEGLEKIARQGRTAFFCAERFPWRCHRWFIAAALAVRGWRVVHIIEENETWMSKDEKEGHEDSASGQIELGLSG